MFSRLLLLFLTVPIIELFALIWVGERIGLLPTLGLIATTAIVGSWLAKREGLATFYRVQSQLSSGEIPGDALMDGLVILVSGVLLLTPGILTDLVGFVGLIPVTRKHIGNALRKRFAASVRRSGPVQFQMFGNAPSAPPGRHTKPPDNEDGTGAVVESS